MVGNGKTIVQAYVDAWNKHDSAAIDTLLAPNAIHEDVARTFAEREAPRSCSSCVGRSRQSRIFKWPVTNSFEEGRYVTLEWTWTATTLGLIRPAPTDVFPERRSSC